MSENTISKILQGIGIGTIIIGVIASFIIGNNTEDFAITIGSIVVSIISGMIFIGFSEIINLLQQNIDNQETIIRYLKEKPEVLKTNTFNKSGQQSQDVVSKFTNSTPKHLFRCANCGKMIEDYPCSECGYKFN